MTLSENEYRLLNVILQEPHLSYTEIAQRLDLSVTSIRNLLFSLMDYSESDELEDDSTHLVVSNNEYKNMGTKRNHNLSFFAKFNYDLLSLDRFDYFITCSTDEQISNVKKYCDAHPYTQYRARIHGGKNGILIIFYMPKEIQIMLDFALQTLKNHHLIDDFSQIFQKSQFFSNTLLKVDVFDVSNNKWNFKLESSIKNYTNNSLAEKTIDYFNLKKSISIIEKLDRIDVMILNEWGYGAGPRKTKAEILNNILTGKIYAPFIKGLKINRYIISDHIDELLKHNLIEYVGIGFDRKKIQIFTTLFYSGEASVEFLNFFANYIQSPEFPFESRLSVGNIENQHAKFTWWVSFNPNIVSDITEYLFSNCMQLETFIVAFNTNDVEYYPLYHANFLPSESKWNISVDYCLFEPLKTFFDPKQIQLLSKDYSQISQKVNK